MKRLFRAPTSWPLAGVILAIAITSVMDFVGLALFTALVLLPLGAFLWRLQRLGRSEVGFRWGRPGHYGLAMLYPLFVIGLTVLVAWIAGATHVTDFDGEKLIQNLLLMGLTGIPMLVLTEEGFFRGWLWASLRRAGQNPFATLLWSSLAFSVWHWSWAVVDGGLDLPAPQIPIYLVNAFLMGVGWGLLRWISGSVLVASVSHAVWNAFAYTLFGAGPIDGALGIDRTIVFDVEVGLVGLSLNLLFTLALWSWWRRRFESSGSPRTVPI